ILACPICKSHPLELLVFAEKEEIDEGVLLCNGCGRWYPIIGTIPHMLPDDLRDANEDRGFLERWRAVMPEVVLKSGKPFSLG
ncbi:MAG TPA: Trm112 family protein, partial [Candidatus Methanomethylicus sp.]|nr:Trm112 family protein [Candidatus Methanomethylicus sp.]